MRDIKKAIALLQKAVETMGTAKPVPPKARKDAREDVLAAIAILTKAALGPDLGPDKGEGVRG
ncbi:MAG: hypothetical protein U5J83_13350 [Bryobacterales bacterium]|nr:hypothetical protein [Bryobacterales bacterium]